MSFHISKKQLLLLFDLLKKIILETQMSDLDSSRIDFIQQLHEAFLSKRGHGAFAYMSITDVLSLYDEYTDSTIALNTFVTRSAYAT